MALFAASAAPRPRPRWARLLPARPAAAGLLPPRGAAARRYRRRVLGGSEADGEAAGGDAGPADAPEPAPAPEAPPPPPPPPAAKQQGVNQFLNAPGLMELRNVRQGPEGRALR